MIPELTTADAYREGHRDGYAVGYNDGYEEGCSKTEENWLDSLPTMPQAPWDDAPEWAMWWAVDACGIANWYEYEPQLAEWDGIYPLSEEWGRRTDIKNRVMGDKDECCLVEILLGIDWRQTLQRRPEETE